MRRPTILIADDHTIVVEGLVRLLKDHFEVVGTVSDAEALIEAAGRLQPDVALTDVSMPGLSGIDALRRLLAKSPSTKVIVLTMHADAMLANEAMRAGAAGFLVKDTAGDTLVSAIHEVLKGRVYLSPSITREVFARMSEPAKSAEPRLTDRQREVLRLIAEGRRMKEIASILQLSTRTVETHKYDMMHALGVQASTRSRPADTTHHCPPPIRPAWRCRSWSAKIPPWSRRRPAPFAPAVFSPSALPLSTRCLKPKARDADLKPPRTAEGDRQMKGRFCNMLT